jgi:quinoprotein glucose dehydrogenase
MLYSSAAALTVATVANVAAQRSPNGAGATANAYPAPPANGAVTQDTSWTAFAGDAKANRYSPLAQINATNFNNLQVAWRFDAARFGPRIETNWEGTPLLIKGRLYVTAGTRRDVICVDAITGELIWMHREDEGERGRVAPRALSGHGVSYWTDGKLERIIYVTQGYRMKSLDIATGIPDPKFGKAGVVDLKLENDQKLDLLNGDIGLHATPLVCNNTIVVGAAHNAGSRTPVAPTGNVRGYDARTGKRLWIFHTIPHKGEFGYDSWVVEGQGMLTGHAGSWGEMCADPELNTVYFGVELPVGDYLGMHRKGPGLFGESLVAVDARTGKRKWHYQMVHHGLWDSDVPCSAMIVDLPVNGRTVKAIAQPTKQCFLYVLNRETGEPIWPIPEVPVKPGDAPDEWYSPTQPIPSKPPAYDRQNVADEDLNDLTPAIRARALQVANKYARGEGVYQAPIMATYEGKWGTLTLPGAQGGTNWPGAAFDPETKIAYVYSKTQVAARGVVKSDVPFGYAIGNATAPGAPPAGRGGGRGAPNPEDEGQDLGGRGAGGGAPAGRGAPAAADGPGGGRGAGGGGGRGGAAGGAAPNIDASAPIQPGNISIGGLPIVKPPYGRISALDLKDGTMAWQVAHGETPDNIKNNPLLKGVTVPRTGQAGNVGPLVTKTVVICGDPENTTDAQGVNSSWLRAYDKATGKEVGAVRMTQGQTGTPMTYAIGGWQYIVLCIGQSATGGSEMIAYRLRTV